MINKLVLPLLALVSVVVFSCSKGSGTNSPDPTPIAAKKKYLTRMVNVSTPPAKAPDQSVTTTISDYEYDSKKRLTKIKTGTNITTFTYTSSGDLFSISADFGSSRTLTEFTYTENKVKSALVTLFQNNAAKDSKTYTYVYFGDKVSEIHQDIYYNKYYYDANGNIVKVFLQGSTPFSYLITLDTSKKSILANALFKFPLPNDALGYYLSPNPVVSQTTEGLNTNNTLTTTFVFDADGYPTSASSSSDFVNSYSNKYTYTYSTLD